MYVEFVLTSLVVVLIPGTGVVYTVSSSIGGGWRGGLFAAFGCTLGIVPHMLAAMPGLSVIMQARAVVFEVVRWVGVAYLIFMSASIPESPALPLLDREQVQREGERGARLISRNVYLDVVLQREPVDLSAPVVPYVLPARLGKRRGHRPQLEGQPLHLYHTIVLGLLDLEAHDVAVRADHVEVVA
jgi:hypothetical protein